MFRWQQPVVFIGRNYQSQNNYSEKYAAEIDAEIKKILDANYKKAKELLTANMDKLNTMAEILLEKQTIYRDEVDMIIAGASKEEVFELMAKKDAERKERDEKAIQEAKLIAEKQAEEQKQIKEQENQLKKEMELSGLITPEQLDELLNQQNKKDK